MIGCMLYYGLEGTGNGKWLTSGPWPTKATKDLTVPAGAIVLYSQLSCLSLSRAAGPTHSEVMYEDSARYTPRIMPWAMLLLARPSSCFMICAHVCLHKYGHRSHKLP